MKSSLKSALIATAALCLAGTAHAQGASGNTSGHGQGGDAGMSAGSPSMGTNPNAAMSPGGRNTTMSPGMSSGRMSSDTMPSGTTTGTRMSESQVRQIQQALKANGHDISVDGRFGPQTEAALRDYQQSRGMTATGRPDSGTLASLGVDATGTAGTSSGMTGGSGRSGAAMSPSQNGSAMSGVRNGQATQGARTGVDTSGGGSAGPAGVGSGGTNQ